MKRLTVYLVIFACLALIGCNLDLLQTPTGEATQPVIEEPTTKPTTKPIIEPTAMATQAVLEAFPVDPVTGMPQGTDGYPWWNDSVYYEIFVRSFYDSNGDGIGDLNGITQKLDYLNDGDPNTTTDLGVTGIWLMPIFPSPSYHGYDVTDYYAINPEFGDMDDLKTLLDAAHQRGIRVIIDLVMNHTSNQHPWFQAATSLSSPYHDWYIWSNNDPGYTGSWGQQVWFPLNGRYYYSSFTGGMPDLNYLNPEVVAEMKEAARFWLQDIGVDGFRLDAAKHIIEEGTIQANSASTHDWWEEFHLFYKQVAPQSLVVGEIWDETAIMAEYLQGDEFDLSFEFYLAGSIIQAINAGNASQINDRLQVAYDLIPDQQFAVFLTNHDQERVMTTFLDSDEKAKVAASVYLTSPGTPFLYYGEEIGMQGEKPDQNIRRPMQWSPAPSSGFTSGTPWEPLGPAWLNYNVKLESADPNSLLSHYRNLIHIRNEHAALRVGELDLVKSTNEHIYSSLRVSENEAVLVLINLSDQPAKAFYLGRLDSPLAEGNYALVPIMGSGSFKPLVVNASGGFYYLVSTPEIAPYATHIFQLQKN